MEHDHSEDSGASRAKTVSRYVFFGFVAIAAYFLITEHRAHVIPFLPFLLLAACPFLHMFHHRGHNHAKDEDDERRSPPGSAPPPSSGSGAHQH